MRYLFLALLLSGCVTRTIVVKETKYVDIETYKTWGTTRLTPIGVRALPTEEELCANPLWKANCPKEVK